MNSLEEIKVGEYVRTTNKGIRQIAMIDNHKTVNKYLYYIGEDFEGKSYAYIKTTEILKHSFNLIDLIEVGDIVNCCEVLDIHTPRDTWEPIEIEINDKYTNFILEDEIKTILTHEQHEENCLVLSKFNKMEDNL